MTKLQQKLVRTYEEDGYSATLTFWAESQNEINALSEKERSSLKNMMSRYCRINGDEKNAGFILEERSDVSDKKIVMHLFWFGNRFLRKDKTYSSEKLYDIISKIVSEEIKDPEMNEIMGKLFALAKAYDTKTDFHQLAFLYDEIFKRADAEQLFILGEMYLNGDVIEQNFQKAVECFQKSALAGNKLSAYRLGEMYMLGLGLAKNKAKAEDFYSAANAEKEFYSNTFTRMAIPEGIEYIAESAFEGFENLRSVIIPESVKKIGDRAFKGCRHLESVKFSNEEIAIGTGAFEDCEKLDEPTKRLVEKFSNFIFIEGAGSIRAFYIAKFPVTQKLYENIMGNNPSQFKGENQPVGNVSWYDAVEFCNKLSEKDGFAQCYTGKGYCMYCDLNKNGYRLPTKAEWYRYIRSNIQNTEKQKRPGRYELLKAIDNEWAEWLWDSETVSQRAMSNGCSYPSYYNEYWGFRLVRNAD